MHLKLLEISVSEKKTNTSPLTCVTGEDDFSDLEDFPSSSFPIDIQRLFKEMVRGSLITESLCSELKVQLPPLHHMLPRQVAIKKKIFPYIKKHPKS